MNFIKLTALTVSYSAVLLAPVIAVAAFDPAAFQADKEQHIANVLERIQVDQKNLSCVQTAEDHAALKACDEAFKQDPDISGTKLKTSKSNSVRSD
ncbi:MAG: hypothetical protein EPN17_18565 [Methylobacter sp.]|nr:MAG: hypothetical protein EPN17_18565 [Methylobacter sp.]